MVHFAAEGRLSLAVSLVRSAPSAYSRPSAANSDIILGEECYELADDLLQASGYGSLTREVLQLC